MKCRIVITTAIVSLTALSPAWAAENAPAGTHVAPQQQAPANQVPAGQNFALPLLPHADAEAQLPRLEGAGTVIDSEVVARELAAARELPAIGELPDPSEFEGIGSGELDIDAAGDLVGGNDGRFKTPNPADLGGGNDVGYGDNPGSKYLPDLPSNNSGRPPAGFSTGGIASQGGGLSGLTADQYGRRRFPAGADTPGSWMRAEPTSDGYEEIRGGEDERGSGVARTSYTRRATGEGMARPQKTVIEERNNDGSSRVVHTNHQTGTSVTVEKDADGNVTKETSTSGMVWDIAGNPGEGPTESERLWTQWLWSQLKAGRTEPDSDPRTWTLVNPETPDDIPKAANLNVDPRDLVINPSPDAPSDASRGTPRAISAEELKNRWTFELAAVSDDGNLLGGNFSVGDSFTTTLSYESGFLDGSPAEVTMTAQLSGFSFTSRSESVDLNSDSELIFFITGLDSDPFIELGSNPGRLMTILLRDSTGSVFQTDSLPTSLDSSDFTSAEFRLFGKTGPGGPTFTLRGDTASLEIIPITVVSFDSLSVSEPFRSVSSEGLVFTSDPTSTGTTSIFIVNTVGCGPPCPDSGTNYLLQNDFGDRQLHTVTMVENTGSPFSLLSFDAGERHIGHSHAARIEVFGTRSSGNIVFASFSLDGVNDGPGPLMDSQTFALPRTFRDLISVTFVGPVDGPIASTSGITQDYTLDNLDVFINAAEPTDIAIDIKPGNDEDNINPRSQGVVQVAILKTDDFDPRSVDPFSVMFGPDGATASQTFVHDADVDNDGDPDLVLRFRTQDTGIECGDTEAFLTGMTLAGEEFEGLDFIKTVECN